MKKAEGKPALRQTDLREHYVPIRKQDLLRLLCHDPRMSADDCRKFRDLARILDATFHYQYHGDLEDLKRAYAPFNPDAPPHQPPLSEAERRRLLDRFFEKLNWILARANFRRLARSDLEAVVGQASAWGVNLDVCFDVFDRLEIYARGAVTGHRALRRLRSFFRLKERDVDIYERLVVVFRLRPHRRLEQDIDTESLYIKVFKEIPRIDLEMLLPGTRVKMSRLDRLKIFGPSSLGILAGLWKIVRGSVAAAAAGLYGLLVYLGIVGGTLGYGVRSFYGYLRTKQRYRFSLTRSLYYQNLGNNDGVLFHLLDEAEEQECREAILGYFLLWKRAGERGWTAQELNDHAEAYIRHVTDRDVDYDIEDALRKFEALNLVEHQDDGRIRAVPIDHALATVDQMWNDYFQYTDKLPASCRGSETDSDAPCEDPNA
jgi:hypothetical protein